MEQNMSDSGQDTGPLCMCPGQDDPVAGRMLGRHADKTGCDRQPAQHILARWCEGVV